MHNKANGAVPYPSHFHTFTHYCNSEAHFKGPTFSTFSIVNESRGQPFLKSGRVPSKAAAAGHSVIPVGNAQCQTTLTKKCPCLPLAGCLPLGWDPEREPLGRVLPCDVAVKVHYRRSHFFWNYCCMCGFGAAWHPTGKIHSVVNHWVFTTFSV